MASYFKDSMRRTWVLNAIYSCKFGQLKRRFKFLGLIRTVDPDSRRKSDSETFLMAASSKIYVYSTESSWSCKRQEEMVKYLIKNGASLDLQNCSGFTALHCAVYDKLSNIVRILVECGADLDICEYSRKLSPLMMACWLKYPDMAIQLIDYGADIEISDYHGFTAIDYAKNSSLYEVVKILKLKGCSHLENPPVPINLVEWYTGAETWEQYAEWFSRSQLWSTKPAFKELKRRIAKFSDEEKHGIWVRLGGNCNAYHRDFAVACYIEALWHDPDPNSVAWGWLTGEYDKHIELLNPDVPRKKESLEGIRHRWGVNVHIPVDDR